LRHEREKEREKEEPNVIFSFFLFFFFSFFFFFFPVHEGQKRGRNDVYIRINRFPVVVDSLMMMMMMTIRDFHARKGKAYRLDLRVITVTECAPCDGKKGQDEK